MKPEVQKYFPIWEHGKRGKFSVKSHFVMQNLFAGNDVLKRSNGYYNQTGESKLFVTKSPHLNEESLKILKNHWA